MKKTEVKPHICICLGSSCYSRGNAELLKELRENAAADEGILLRGSLCMGNCSAGPNVSIDGSRYQSISIDRIKRLLDRRGAE